MIEIIKIRGMKEQGNKCMYISGEAEAQGENIMKECNFNTVNIITPVNAEVLLNYLVKANYDATETSFLYVGFKEGFRLEYNGPTNRRDKSNNIPLRIGSKTELWNKMMKEVKQSRVAGPFKEDEIPFRNFIQSPIALVPKGEDKTRMIFHLSYDFDEYYSVNHYIPDNLCLVQYSDLDNAVISALELNTTPIFYGKTDVSSVFRLVPLNKSSWAWLVMMAEDPETAEKLYFFDKCLPFGSSISCAHFQRFSDALKFITQHQTKLILYRVVNYLDNFLLISISLELCNKAMKAFLKICTDWGVPIAVEKTVWGTTCIIFLGILLDRRKKILVVPEDKRREALNFLSMMINQRKAKVKDMEKLAGFLNFLNKVIFPGRAFT